MTDAPEEPANRLPIVRIAVWQAGAVAAMITVAVASGRGSPAGIVSGALLMFVSLLLQHLAFRLAVRGGARSGAAIGLFLVKLTLLLAVAAVGFQTTLLAPMSFAAGASTLLLAIVIDSCYPRRSTSRPR
jgi:hypothetical protein